MDILLWRHAEAEDGPDDMNRALTKKGREQARVMAEWITTSGIVQMRVISSPALRARQTADSLGLAYEISDMLRPERSADHARSLIDQASKPPTQAILLVGHQPTLGRLATHLAFGTPMDCAVEKGGVWWLRLDQDRSPPRVRLRAVAGPKLVRQMHQSPLNDEENT